MQRSRPRMQRVSRDSYGTKKRSGVPRDGVKVETPRFSYFSSFLLFFFFFFVIVAWSSQFVAASVNEAHGKIFFLGFCVANVTGAEKLFPPSFASSFSLASSALSSSSERAGPTERIPTTRRRIFETNGKEIRKGIYPR